MRLLDLDRSSISVRVAPTAQVGATHVAMTFQAGELRSHREGSGDTSSDGKVDSAGDGWAEIRIDRVDLSPALLTNRGQAERIDECRLGARNLVRLSWNAHAGAGSVPPLQVGGGGRRRTSNPPNAALLPITLAGTGLRTGNDWTIAAATTVIPSGGGVVAGRVVLDPQLFGISAPAFLNVLVHVNWRALWREPG